MSGFLKRNTKTVNPAGGVNPASSPNVSQYGWTSFDAGNVNQIIEYVNICKEYANSAKESADFVANKFGEIAAFIAYVEAAYEQLKPVLDNIELIYTDIEQKHAEVTSMHKDVRTWSVLAVASATSAKDSADEVKGFITQAEDSAKASAASATASKTSETGSKDWYDKSKELYDDLKEGQVYRGTWNPVTNAYPAKPDTNSAWDVSLPSGTSSHDFDGKEWRSGDRLLFAVATGAFEQLAVGGGVDSVNGKTGAVTLAASDVGAYPTTGGFLNAPVIVRDNSGLRVEDKDGSYGMRVVNSGGSIYMQAGKTDRDVADQKMVHSGWYGTPLSFYRLIMAEGKFPYVQQGGTDYRMYHQGFKPTAADVGAVGLAGTQTMTGQLNAVKFTATDSYGFVSKLRNTQGMYLGNNDNDRRTIIGGGDDVNKSGTIHLRPNGITDVTGEVIVRSSGQISAPMTPISNDHLTNKVYVDTSVKAVSDKVDAIGPDAINAMPKTGGTFTGPVTVQSGAKNALKVNNKASISYQDDGGTVFHNFMSGNSLQWSHGIGGENNLMILESNGSLYNEGPQYSRTGMISRSRGGSNGGTWISIESPEEAAPYIATKVNAENTATIAMRFGRTEVSIESDKRLAATSFRVQNDGGLKFAPTNDISGLTWAMGVNPNDRSFGLHYYNNGGYGGQTWHVNSSGATTVYGPSLTVTGNTYMTNYVSIASGTNNILEFHQPGQSACMVYKPVNTSDFRIAQSNGAGGEAAMYANINASTASFRGQVASQKSVSRGWSSAGDSVFYGAGSTVAEGALSTLVAQWVTVPGRASYEHGYGFLSDGSGNIGNYGHAFFTQDSGSYLKYWIFRDNGGQQSPSGFRIEGDGRMAGKAYEGYEDHFHWVTASLASTSDANLKTIVGDSVKSALDVVNQFQFKRFVWNEEAGSIYTSRNKKLTDIGLIAQQVEEVDPSLVKTISVGGDTPTETKTLDTAAMLALAMKAIQEQQVQINELKEKLNEYVQH